MSMQDLNNADYDAGLRAGLARALDILERRWNTRRAEIVNPGNNELRALIIASKTTEIDVIIRCIKDELRKAAC